MGKRARGPIFARRGVLLSAITHENGGSYACRKRVFDTNLEIYVDGDLCASSQS